MTPEQIEILQEQARQAILSHQSASVAMLQRALKLGWNRSNALMSQFEGELVSAPLHGGGRIVLPRVLDLTHTDHPVNTYWLRPEQLMAGEYPGAPDLAVARRKLQDFLNRGFTAFLDLTEAGELCHYEPLLAELARERRIDCEYRRMPIRDVDVPEHPRQMHDILEQIQRWLRQGRQIYFHCWGGVGRTGTVAGCYLVQHSYSGEAALAQLQLLWTRMSADKRRRKPESPETQAQRDYVLNWDAMETALYLEDQPDDLV